MKRCKLRTSIVLLPLGLLACGTPSGTTTGEEEEEAGLSTEETDPGITAGNTDTDPSTDPKLDQAADMDVPEGEQVGCEKIDFLFVIDSSGSMADNQANLIASFPGLVTAMMDNVEADDWHVMVVDVDQQWSGTDCANACQTLGSCPGAPEFDCDTPPPGVCDITLGAGETAPFGEAASNQECALASDSRYIEAGEPDPLGAFSCIARVGIDGSDAERPMDALTRALSPELNDEGECNEGFVRDDAILVITVITDEPDEHSPGDPADWYDAVLAAKGEQAEAVVVLGLLPDGDLDQPLCGVESVPAPRMSPFLDLFENSSRASVCEPDYSPFFVDAVSVIGEACENFVPIG